MIVPIRREYSSARPSAGTAEATTIRAMAVPMRREYSSVRPNAGIAAVGSTPLMNAPMDFSPPSAASAGAGNTLRRTVLMGSFPKNVVGAVAITTVPQIAHTGGSAGSAVHPQTGNPLGCLDG